MKILSVDTANNSCSAAISDKKQLLAETCLLTTTTHSKHLMSIIEGVLEISGLNDLSMIDFFSVSVGPGSFTGLRIGISTVTGLAKAFNKPIVGISALDALAFQFPFVKMPIYSLIDARRQEVYWAVYNFSKQGVLEHKNKEQVSSPDLVLKDIEERCLFVGSGALFYEKLIVKQLGNKAIFVPYYLNTIKASVIAMRAFENIKQNRFDLPIVPKYIRKSDAEINFNKG